jgi:hypothetical protein
MVKQFIYWDGIGSKLDGIHTKKEFLYIVHTQYSEMIYRRIKGILPPNHLIKKDDVNRWMEFVGAIYI